MQPSFEGVFVILYALLEQGLTDFILKYKLKTVDKVLEVLYLVARYKRVGL